MNWDAFGMGVAAALGLAVIEVGVQLKTEPFFGPDACTGAPGRFFGPTLPTNDPAELARRQAKTDACNAAEKVLAEARVGRHLVVTGSVASVAAFLLVETKHKDAGKGLLLAAALFGAASLYDRFGPPRRNP